jgi:MFS family permease
MDRSLWAVLIGTFTLRFSTGLTGAALQAYLAQFGQSDGPYAAVPAVSSETVGLLAASFFVAELILSPVFGLISDRVGHHRVMLWGPVFGAAAVLLTAVTSNLLLLGGTRLLEGASTGASVPPILGYIAVVTAGSEALRGRAASRFEAATLSGLGIGFITAPTLFGLLGAGVFVLNAAFYLVSLAIYALGVREPVAPPAETGAEVPAADLAAASPGTGTALEHTPFRRYLALVSHAHVLLLAPTWIALNAALGLWMSQTLFQLYQSNPAFPSQWLMQGFEAWQITAGALFVAIVFAIGLLWWGNRFDRFRRTTIILFGVLGGIGIVVAAEIVNHTALDLGTNVLVDVVVAISGAVIAVGLFSLAGATPAAVGLLADVSERFPADRGAIMGLYSVFLAIGQIIGSLIGGVAADWRGMDGLLVATGLLLLIGLVPLFRLRRVEHYLAGPQSPAVL